MVAQRLHGSSSYMMIRIDVFALPFGPFAHTLPAVIVMEGSDG